MIAGNKVVRKKEERMMMGGQNLPTSKLLLPLQKRLSLFTFSQAPSLFSCFPFVTTLINPSYFGLALS